MASKFLMDNELLSLSLIANNEVDEFGWITTQSLVLTCCLRKGTYEKVGGILFFFFS